MNVQNILWKLSLTLYTDLEFALVRRCHSTYKSSLCFLFCYCYRIEVSTLFLYLYKMRDIKREAEGSGSAMVEMRQRENLSTYSLPQKKLANSYSSIQCLLQDIYRYSRLNWHTKFTIPQYTRRDRSSSQTSRLILTEIL